MIFLCICASARRRRSRRRGDARPFDAEADGTILGEGLGVLVLKRLDDARRDGDRIYAVIRSMGSSSDGKGQAVYAPSRRGAGQGARSRLTSSPGIEPGDGRAGRGPRDRNQGRRRDRAGGARGGLSGGPAGGLVVRLGIGQVAGGAHQGRRRRGRADQGRAGAPSQGVAADIEGSPADRARSPAATRRFT